MRLSLTCLNFIFEPEDADVALSWDSEDPADVALSWDSEDPADVALSWDSADVALLFSGPDFLCANFRWPINASLSTSLFSSCARRHKQLSCDKVSGIHYVKNLKTQIC